MQQQAEEFTESLLALGFSSYEARCYVGLLGPEPQTGYAVAKATGVPQPKVYEALRRLVARGAARQLGSEPVRFVAVPPREVLDGLESTFEDHLTLARSRSVHLTTSEPPPEHELVYRFRDRARIITAASAMIDASEQRVYVSSSPGELRMLREPVERATGRGVDVVALCFGRVPFSTPGMRVFRHASTDGVLYRAHQARHLGLVTDSRETLFGLAADGQSWTGIQSASEAVIAAVKGYIRHDIDMQQVFNDFESELVAAYGPGLQGLESYRAAQTGETPAAQTPASAEAPGADGDGRPGQVSQAG
ncbi:TrmB family transcriptional regulator [Streptomyces sp. NPDC091281]|uniref:TrmB family transcriptional regulator n=1 Tax=Streptomyces sp. NPDC091281 TaxID=3365985 RepID=UPI00381DAB2F